MDEEYRIEDLAADEIAEVLAEEGTELTLVEAAALKKARPKFDIGASFKLVEGKEVIGYHFEGAGPMGQHKTISVSPDGKQVELVSVDD